MKIFALAFFQISAFAAPPTEELTVAQNTSELIRLPGITRVVTSNAKVAAVRSLSSSEVLISGKHAGSTTVHLWNASGIAKIFTVKVIPGLSTDTVKVLLEFYELDVTHLKQLGIKWPEAIQFVGNAVARGGAESIGFNSSLTLSSARGLLRHLLEDGTAQVLSRPEMFVRLGEEATFHSGGEIPVSTSTENHGRYHRHVEWKPFGLTVKVRPQSWDHYHLCSDVHAEISDLSSAGGVDSIPGITKRSVTTKMNSLDGESIVLSGLVRREKTESKDGLPILSSFPIIGKIFSSEQTKQRETDVLIALTLAFNGKSQNVLDRQRERWSETH